MPSSREHASKMDHARHELACGAVVTLTLEGDVGRCRHQGFRCPDVELLARAVANELAQVVKRQTAASFLFSSDRTRSRRKPDRRQLELAFSATRPTAASFDSSPRSPLRRARSAVR